MHENQSKPHPAYKTAATASTIADIGNDGEAAAVAALVSFGQPRPDSKSSFDCTYGKFFKDLDEEDIMDSEPSKKLMMKEKATIFPHISQKNPKSILKMLEDEESWEILLNDVSDYITACKSKNHGKGVVKAFTVFLVDF